MLEDDFAAAACAAREMESLVSKIPFNELVAMISFAEEQRRAFDSLVNSPTVKLVEESRRQIASLR